MPLSHLEARFRLLIEAAQIPMQYQYRLPGSRYIWDAAYLERRILIEVDGGQWLKRAKAHGYGEGMERDCRKQNEAALAGWRVLRFCTSMIADGSFMDTIDLAVNG